MRTRVALVAVGAVLIAYAMVGVLTDADADPIGMLVFLLAVLVGHDLVWLPVALAAGLLIARGGPGVRIAALVAVSVSVVALPLVLGIGRPADNPSVLPLHYGRHLALILLVIAAVTAAAAIRRKLTRRRRERSTPAGRG
jgi:hypothetical protein